MTINAENFRTAREAVDSLTEKLSDANRTAIELTCSIKSIINDFWIDDSGLYPGRIIEYRSAFYRFSHFNLRHENRLLNRMPPIEAHKVLKSGKSHKLTTTLYQIMGDINIMPKGHELEADLLPSEATL